MQKLDIGISSVEQIFHIADIHIRNYNRHDEYRKIFTELYKAVDDLPEKSIVYIAGDIVHNKIDMSPELIDLTSEFLRELANRRPTIFIRGNHDMNLNNKSRMDALRPIYDSLKHPNLHYLDKTEVYDVADLYLSVFDIADDHENYIQAKDIPDDKLKVAFFHGAVDSSMTDGGFKVTNLNHGIGMFAGYDLVLLGDIHKHQYLDVDKRVHYPGSLVQQNFGEAYENHGYTTWNTADLSSSFTHIHNDHGFYTIDITDGVLPSIKTIPKFPRLRIRTTNTTEAELKTLLSTVRKKATFADAMVVKLDKLAGTATNKTSKALVNNVRDVEYQNELIGEYIERNFSADPAIIDRVKNINRGLNKDLAPVEISRNIFWKAKGFEFSNMFSYGPDNSIDFDKASGLMGLFAANHSGKSAILDSIAFCLFDKCSRTKKAEDVMNNRSLNFYCKFNFEVDGVDFFVERKAKRVKSGKSNVKVDVNFWMIGEDGSEVSLNGEQRRDTNKNIRGYVGKYEDFELTALSAQNNSTGFINKSQTERKDSLAQFMDITVFEEIYALANEEIRDVQVSLREFKKMDYDRQLLDAEVTLQEATTEYATASVAEKELKQTIAELSSKILEKSKQLRQTIPHVDIDALIEKSGSLVKALSDKYTLQETFESQTEANKERYIGIASELEQIDYTSVDSNVTDYYETITDRDNTETKLTILMASAKQKRKLVDELENHSYNPDCSHCVDNPFVKQAKQAQTELVTDKTTANAHSEKIAKLEASSEDLYTYVEQKSHYDTLKVRLGGIKAKQLDIKVDKANVGSTINNLKLSMTGTMNSIAEYHANKRDLEHNKTIEAKITIVENDLAIATAYLDDIQSSIKQKHTERALARTTISQIEESIDNANDVENKLKAYEYYLEAIKRDGVPYELISEVLPLIQDEVNEILAQLVEFTVIFETDGKNILTFIKYDKSSWPLELTSGMEKFISSLAIRVALINVSNLPRPNFLAIDEGFGTLDSENLNSMFMLFDYLKSEFSFILVISHLDALRDVADNLFEINVTNDFSKITF